MAKNDNLQDFVTDIADTLRSALKKDSTHKINPQKFSEIITEIADGSTIETEDITISPAETTQEVTRSEGKYINKVTVNPIQTESLDVVPTQSSQAIQAPNGKYYKDVNVGAVTSSIDSNITPINIRLGVSILGVQGNLEPDKPNQTKTVDPSTETQVVMADPEYELESVTVNAVTSDIDSNIQPENIKKDVTILGVTGTVEEGGGKVSPEYVRFDGYNGKILDLSWLDTSNITDMSSMFSNCMEIKTLDLRSFDTSKVTSMSYMFNSCQALTNLDISNFNTTNVTKMNDMFNMCHQLNNIDTHSFDTSNVTNMSGMFVNFNGLSIDVKHFNTSKVTNMSNMFASCQYLTSLDLSNFDTREVTNMSYMFSSCRRLISLNISSFNTSKVTNMSSMFQFFESLTSLDLSNFDTSNVTNMSTMFYNSKGIKNIIGILNMQKVTSASNMFYSCPALEEVHIHNLGVNLSLSASPNITHDCLVELINNLKTVTSTKTLTLGSTNLAKLTDAEKQVATNKGWTLA